MVSSQSKKANDSGILRSSNLGTGHAMFNREQGVSPGPFASLNLGFGVGDAKENVTANRSRVKALLGVPVLVSARQIHADRVYRVGRVAQDTEVDGYDALISDRPGTGLLIQQADCQAVLLHDPVRKAIGAVHCGWRGNVLNIIRTTVEQMREAFMTDPADLHAVISPSLGPCCAEFVHYDRELPGELHIFQVKRNYFDFWEISRSQLTGAGVLAENIALTGICTCCTRSYFSYRRSTKQGNPTTGRHGSVVLLNP